MKTLSEQLATIYDAPLKELIEQLKVNGLRDKLQCPFLLSVYRTGLKMKEIQRLQENADVYDKWYAENMISSNEDWYAKADIKIMFFGKEPNGWTRDEENNRTDISTIMDEYGFFLDDRYEVRANGGYFNQGSSFFKVGVNKIMEGMEMILNDYPNKRVSMIWNEISKLSTRKKNGGGPVNPFIHEIERKYFHVIPEEIKILKPDIVIFYTGPGENSYYRYITEEGNFTLNGEPEQLGSLDKYDVVKLPIKEVGLAYKTWHPARMNKELREQVYGAILADIKENIDKLLKKE